MEPKGPKGAYGAYGAMPLGTGCGAQLLCAAVDLQSAGWGSLYAECACEVRPCA